MYRIDRVKVAYEDPWVSTFAEQVASLAKSSIHIAFYTDEPNNSTFRYRVYNMLQALEHVEPSVGAGYFQYSDLDSFNDVLALADFLVINRSKYSHKLANMIARAKAKGIPVLYDVDDYVFDITKTHLVTHTLDQKSNDNELWDFWFAYVGRIAGALQLCDVAVTTNQFLAEQIETFSGIPTAIIPNFLNQEQLTISEKLYQQKVSRDFRRNRHFHIGYFSGTPSHNKDFDIALDALITILDEYPQAVLRIVGFMNDKPELQHHQSQIEFVPLTDFVNLQNLIAETEVNIVPLQQNEFTNCKSQLKYFEAAVVGTVTVASPTFTYQQSITHGQNGYLAKPHEWYDILAHLIENPEDMPPIIEAAHEHSLKTFGWEAQISLLKELYNIP